MVYLSVVIPCLNAEAHIGRCLDSVLSSGYQLENMEILIVDGMSQDGTRPIISKYSERYPQIRLVENPRRTIPSAMNLGIVSARGEIIARVDAHSTCSRGYFDKCLKELIAQHADVAGGERYVRPRHNTLMGRAIVFVLSNPFGVGNSSYLAGKSLTPKWVDTVPSGCYRKSALMRIGLFDERLSRSEDADVHNRIRATGGGVLLVPGAISYYMARSTLREFVRHSALDGFWITYPLRFKKFPSATRHIAPLGLVLISIALSVMALRFPFGLWILLCLWSSYLLFLLYFSSKWAVAEKNLLCLPAAFLAFLSLHLPYGAGSAWGLLIGAASFNKATESNNLLGRRATR